MSHGIKSVRVTNFCSCKEVTLPLVRYTPLVGYNNAGKSNVIEAIYWLLKKSTLDETKFNDTNEPVVVEAIVEGVTEELLQLLAPNHRAAIEPYNEGGLLRVRRKQPNPNCTAAQIVFEVRDPQVGEDDAENAWGRPGGIENAIKELFPEPIAIKAMDDASGDVSKAGKSNTIGRLIAEIIQPIDDAHGHHIRQVLDNIGAKLSYDGAQRAPELNEFDQAITNKLSDLFPGINLKLHVPTPKIEDIFKNGTIKIFEDGYGDIPKDLSAFGHGAQRAVQMALVRHLAEVRRGAERGARTTLLLIDEPELYLHPQAIEGVRVALKRLTNEGYQILFTTHAAQMIPSEDVAKALLIHKSIERGTEVRQRIDQAVSQVIEDAASQLDVLFSLTNSNQVLFSETVLLSEGKTERKLIPRVFEKLTETTLAERKIALVEQQGVDNTAKSMQVLNALDIPTKALVDFDFAFRGAVQADILDENDIDLQACKASLARIAEAEGITLTEDGLPRRGGGLSASDGFKILASQDDIVANIESIHQKLLQNNIWVWTKGAIEEHLGNDAKNERHLSRFAQRLEQENPRDLFDDFDTVNQFCVWLTE